MAGKPQRYQIMERYMTVALCVDAILFFFYLEIFYSSFIAYP